jgi:hypothetical protein
MRSECEQEKKLRDQKEDEFGSHSTCLTVDDKSRQSPLFFSSFGTILFFSFFSPFLFIVFFGKFWLLF